MRRPSVDSPDPVRLRAGASAEGALLRDYERRTLPPEAESTAAWRRLKVDLEDPPARRRAPAATLCSALAAACLAIWLCAPGSDATDDASLAAAGGRSGRAVATGGTEGASGVRAGAATRR